MKENASTERSISAEEALRLLFPDMELLARLEKMRVAAGSRIKGTLAGKRRSSSLGGSQEFADYRPYAPGDDIRRIDWNVYGRTGRAYMRQYWDEQELQVHLYVDVSRSMEFGGSSANKLNYALRLAACIGYAALSGDDRVTVKLFDDRIRDELPPLHGRASSSKLFRFLASSIRLESPPETPNRTNAVHSNISTPFQKAGSLPRRSGTTWLFTDAMFEQGVEETLISLQAARQQVVLVQLLSPEELAPNLAGELKLIDSELGTGKEVAIGYHLLKQYRAEVEAHQFELKRICAERGAAYLFIDTGQSLGESLLQTLLASQVLVR